ncbi:MAG: SNF2-related protein [Rhodobacteraceae bacterium]|nr:SNF2-related protein [Paracoccaceae bacterium]
MTAYAPFECGDAVSHEIHGTGRVLTDLGTTVVVRFGGRLQQVVADELQTAAALKSAIKGNQYSGASDSLLRAQALAICSINDQWGVFSRSRVKLLPYQLWVCRKVNQTWPFRWLVADDVGLGKTIECGLILTPQLASGRVKRLLILTPAKLVVQWQYRLKDMFDIRLQRYVSAADREGSDFWAAASMVVASFHTLRDVRRGAKERLLEAEPWDLVVVDEAHHLSTYGRRGETLAYGLVSDLQDRNKINSLLFFTGTPHRGKDYGFFGLLQLLRPDLFDPENDSSKQLPRLREVMIRNNKATVTDLRGKRLFKPAEVHSREYSYNAEEQHFYETLSSFIVDGRAYAATLTGREETTRMLVLTVLQKLAASSIAAIRSTLQRRVNTLRKVVGSSGRVKWNLLGDNGHETLDDRAEAEETVPEATAVTLMKGEISRLNELIALSQQVPRETKIERLLDMIETEFDADEQVLLFTEYKATQALVVNALQRRFGFGCATFINGDDQLHGVLQPTGISTTHSCTRGRAANDFNEGRVRFLVSTEAGGEGIDLQERCAVLVHVDMPWNPMRLHQRVGRLSRYGQSRTVRVYILRNHDTVEARIWALLNSKLENIQKVYSSVMDVDEDITQLVVGLVGNAFFDRLFSDASALSNDNLADWFDKETATLGGDDALTTVRNMNLNVSQFDFQRVSKDLPKVDLPDLRKFFSSAVGRHKRRVSHRNGGLTFKTPEEWMKRSYVLRDKYDGLVFERGLPGQNSTSRVLGIGHSLFDVALGEAKELLAFLSCVDGLEGPLLILKVEDEITGTGALVDSLIFGVAERSGDIQVLRDWELLTELNCLKATELASTKPTARQTKELVDRLKASFDRKVSDYVQDMKRPVSWAEMLLVPSTTHGEVAQSRLRQQG